MDLLGGHLKTTKMASTILFVLLILTWQPTLISAKESVDGAELDTVDEALIVKKISFEGVRETPDDFFRVHVQTKIGAEISPDQLSKDIKNLYKNTGFFSDVDTNDESPITVIVKPSSLGGLEVIYRLIESPKIESVQIIGNERLKSAKIQKNIYLKPSEIYSDRRRWDSERGILKAYKQKGHYLASIKGDADFHRDTNTIEVTFTISEGERIKINEITFIGNDRITTKALTKQLKTRVDKHFDEDLLDQDLILLRHYYQDRGFAQVEIQGYDQRFTNDRAGLIIEITVDEGPEYIIDKYDIKIKHSKKPAFAPKKIRKMLDPLEGEVFDRGAFQESIENIQQSYQDAGYLLAEVTPIPHFDETVGRVDISLKINEGDVILIDTVQINGLEKTKEDVIKRELNRLDLKSGEFLDVRSLRKARQKFFQMGPFIKNVDFRPTPNNSGTNSRDLKVDITETSRTGMFSLGGGYGTEGGVFGVAEIGENNLLGRAYRVHLKGEKGARDRHTAELRLNTPWILGTPTRLNVSLYNTRRLRRYYNRLYQNQALDRYVDTRKGGAVTIGRSIAQDIDISVRFKNEDTHAKRGDPLFNITIEHQVSLDRGDFSNELLAIFAENGRGLSNNPEIEVNETGRKWSIEDQEDDAAVKKFVIRHEDEAAQLDVYTSGQHPFDRSVRSVTLFLSRDTRDYRTSMYDPVSGSLNTISYEHSGGLLRADSEFKKYSLDSSWFVTSWHNHVFAAHAKAGYLDSRRNDSSFLFLERFLLGGIDTIRGYEDYEIFPTSENVNGGNKVFYANFEYRIPLGKQLTGSLFFDIGQVWDEFEPNIFDDIDFKKGAGIGVRFNLLGMLARLEYGYGFDRQIEGRTSNGKFHFTIGPGF